MSGRLAHFEVVVPGDDTGFAMLEFPGPGLASVEATHHGRRETRYDVPLLPGQVTNVELQFATRVELRIAVRTESGQPVAGAAVTVTERPPITVGRRTWIDSGLTAGTDSEGIARFEYTPRSVFYARVHAPGRYAPVAGFRATSEPVQEHVVTMKIGECVTLTAVDGRTRQPVADVPIHIDLDFEVVGSVEGNIGVLVTDGSGRIRFCRPGKARATYQVRATEAWHGHGWIEPGISELTISMSPGSELRCRPVARGFPVPGPCQVDYDLPDRGRILREPGMRDEGGAVLARYQGERSSPAFRLRVDGVGCSAWTFHRRKIPAAPIDIELLDLQRVHGRVLDAHSGSPIPGLLVHVGEVRGPAFAMLGVPWMFDTGSSLTGPDGRFEAVMPPGNLLELRVFGGPAHGTHFGLVDLRTSPDGDVGDIRLSGSSVLELLVTGKGRPEGFCFGWLVRRGLADQGPDSFRRLFRTAHDGRAVIDGLAPGKYSILLSGPMPCPPDTAPSSLTEPPTVCVGERGVTRHAFDIFR